MRLVPRFSLVLAAAGSLSLLACGGGGDDGNGMVDPPIGDHYQYVMDFIDLPTAAGEGDSLGLDVDGHLDCDACDPAVDNQLGDVFITVGAAAGGLDLQGGIDDNVNDGGVILLADLQATALDMATRVGYQVYFGANPTPAPCTDINDPLTCGQHLMGTGMFDIATDSPMSALVVGSIVNGRYAGGPGNLPLRIVISGITINLNLLAARVELSSPISADGPVTGKVAGAISQNDLNTNVIPAIATTINTTVEEDCGAGGAPPSCGCAGGSTGETLVGLFDTMPNDCTVTALEIQNNGFVRTVLAPDVDLMTGQDDTTVGEPDGEKDSVSLGVGIRMVKATF